MHGEDADAGVYDLHAVEAHNVGDRAAAAEVDLAELRELVADVPLIEDAADLAEVLRVRVVAAALAARARELVEDHAAAKVGDVLLVIGARIERVVSARDVGGEHLAVREAAAQGEVALRASYEAHELGDGILEETRLHARRADAADLLLVDEQAAGGAALARVLEHRAQGGVGADAVVLPVGERHAAVEAELARLARRHKAQLSGLEVLLRKAVFLLDEGEHARLDALLVLFLQRVVADEDVEVLALDDLGARLLHLLLREMDEQVGHAEHGIVLRLADADVDGRTVFLHDDAVHRERQRRPLVFLDTAVVVGVEVGEPAVLVERVLLDVEAAGVDVRAEDVHAVRERRLADLEEDDGLLHVDGIDLVARLEALAALDEPREVAIACGLRLAHGLLDALALRLAAAEEVAVARIECLELLFLLLVVGQIYRCFLFFLCHENLPFQSERQPLRRHSQNIL